FLYELTDGESGDDCCSNSEVEQASTDAESSAEERRKREKTVQHDHGLQDLVRNIDIKPFHVKTEHLVNITHFNDPHDFYVRNVKYMHVVLKIENLKRLPPACSVEMDEIVLFDMDTDSSTTKYARGQVRNIEEIAHSVICTLSAIDYGFFVKVPLECIYKCDNLVLVFLAYKCRLARFEKKGDSWGLAIDSFKSYVSTIEHTKMLIEGQIADKLIVKLGKTEKEDLATILSYTRFTRLAGVPDKIVLQLTAAALPINLSGYTLKDQKKVKLQVTVLSSSSLQDFYVAEINDYKQYIDSREICHTGTQMRRRHFKERGYLH
ncbi:jg3149, partial [Pararge aegeria aegeria]